MTNTPAFSWWLATARSKADGQRAVLEAARSGQWRQDADAWFEVARNAHGPEHPPPELVHALVEEMCSRSLDDAARRILPGLCNLVRYVGMRDALAAVSAWLAPQIEPGDAGLLVETLAGVHWHRPDGDLGAAFPVEVMPLVRALLLTGAAELRAVAQTREAHVRGGDIHWRLALSVFAHEQDDLLPVALRYLASSQRAASFDERIREQLWPMVERGLELGLESGGAVDVLHLALGVRWMKDIERWRPLVEPARFPLTARALLGALADDKFHEHHANVGWEVAVRSKDLAPAALPPLAAERVFTIVDVVAAFDRPYRLTDVDMPSMEALSIWARVAARALAGWYASTFDDGVRRQIARQLTTSRNALHSAVCEGVREGLERAPASVSPDLAPSRALIAALLAAEHPAASPRSKRPDLDERLELIRRELERLLATGFRPVRGVDFMSIVGQARRVELAHLPGERAVFVEADVVRIERDFPERVCNGSGSREDIVRSVLLYVVHELVHVAQGFDGKEKATTARAVGVETAIAHMDLEADHITTLLIAQARPEWSVDDLKDRTGRGVTRFPLRRFHTSASRQRKALRFVSSRFDLIARRRGLLSPNRLGDSFFYLDYAPSGETCLVFFAGPPLALACAPIKLSPAEHKVLVAAADGDVPFETQLRVVDEVVELIVERARASLARPFAKA